MSILTEAQYERIDLATRDLPRETVYAELTPQPAVNMEQSNLLRTNYGNMPTG